MKATRTGMVTIDHLNQLDLWQHIDRSSPNGCWPWTRGATRNGYGKTTVPKRITGIDGPPIAYYAHKAAYAIDRGEIPDPTLVIDHRCGNKLCCNPRHIQSVTQRLNARRGERPTMKPVERPRSDGGSSWVIRWAEYDPATGERVERGCTFRDPGLAAAVSKAIYEYRLDGGDIHA